MACLACNPGPVTLDGDAEAESESDTQANDEVGESSSESSDSSTEASEVETDDFTETDTPTDLPEPPPEPPPPAAVVEVAVGRLHTCVILDDASIACWGRNEDGRLGKGHMEDLGDDEFPCGRVDIGGPAVAIDSGHSHSCAVRDDGAVYCWGYGHNGQLGYGNGDNVGNNEAVVEVAPVDVGDAAEAVFVGPYTSCARTVGQDLVCWGSHHGYPGLGRLGDNEHPSSAGAVDVGGVVIDMGFSSGNTCAVLDGGAVRCWGVASSALGYDLGEPIGDDESPASVPPLELSGPAIAIDGGWSHMCALLEDGGVQCWGWNGKGQLGYGNWDEIGDDEAPASAGTVKLGEPAVAITAGPDHSCAVTASGALYCWGDDDSGQLGYPGNQGFVGGEIDPVDAGAVALPGVANAVGGGYAHTCALLGDALHCWGAGWAGQLGTASQDEVLDPATTEPVGVDCPDCCAIEPEPEERLDGERDVRIYVESVEALPATIVDGASLRVQGAYWPVLQCEGCNPTFVVRDGADQTLLFARTADYALDPGDAVLASLGIDEGQWYAPLELSVVDPQLCGPIVDDCMGQGTRLAIDVSAPGLPDARVLDSTLGLVGDGLTLSANTVETWSDGLCDEGSVPYALTLARRACAPDCGPVSVAESCEAPAQDLLWAGISFDREPVEVAYDLDCVVLDIVDEPAPFSWELELDCVGYP